MRAPISLGPALAIVVLCTACTIDSGNDNPFATSTPVTSSPPVTDTGDATESASSGTEGASTGEAGSTTGSTGVADSTSGGPQPTTGVSAEDSTTSGGGNGMQPDMGMWAACEIPEDCSYSPSLCITVTDDMMNLLGGFCSDVGCANPAVDCAPSPNGIAMPTCVPVTVNGAADTACALACTGGLACPAPMQCLDVTGFGEICA